MDGAGRMRRFRAIAVLMIGLVVLQGLGGTWSTRQIAAAGALTLAPDNASSQQVGTTIGWTATPPDGAARTYRFTVNRAGEPAQIVRDFAPEPTFSWTALDEGDYAITVIARDDPAVPGAPALIASAPFRLTSRITGGRPVVSATRHPLVALYSIPACGTGTVQVIFGTGTDGADYQRTPVVNCSPLASTNLYLVGMRPTTTYAIQYAIVENGATRYGPLDSWTTGAIPDDIHFPEITTLVPPDANASLQEGLLFRISIGSRTSTPQKQLYATDLMGNVNWYLPDITYVARPLPGGNILAYLNEGAPNAMLRLLDPAGNTVHETWLSRLNEQVLAFPVNAGQTIEPIRGLHHEVNLLPNGHIAVLAYTEKIFPPGTQGSTTGTPVDVAGDAIIILDQNFQVTWVWNAFDHLDLNRAATLGDICLRPGCGIPLQYVDPNGGVAHDWLHSNAISYSPVDGNLLLSVRHQDWIIKLDYQNGQGDGHIVWKLGKDGDFVLSNPLDLNDPFPWFSHQHAIEMTSDGRLITFDNGNMRCEGAIVACHSRGQVYQLNEAAREATRIVNADLGDYSSALGWAQLLQNGNYAFTSGFQMSAGTTFAHISEFDPTGTALHYRAQDTPEGLYRSYRMATMYDGCCSPTSSITPLPPSATPVPTTTLAVTIDGAGAVNRTPDGGTSGPFAFYAPGTSVTLTAQPTPGNYFVGWQIDGNDGGTNPTLTVQMDTDRTIVARFTAGPAGSAVTLTIATAGAGTIFRTPATAPTAASEIYARNTVVTLIPQPAPGSRFIGWRIDGADRGWAPTLTLTLDAEHAVEGRFAPLVPFADLTTTTAGANEAITQLTVRGIIKGCDQLAQPPSFCPNDTTLRAQMAALIVRAMGWGGENPTNPFTDRDGVDDELWRAIAILADRGVVNGYGDGIYGTVDNVLNVQVIAFITRAMVDAGYWQAQPDNPSYYPNVPASSGHRQDLATYVHYAGPVRGAENLTGDFTGWDQPASRGYFAFALWQALDSYFGADQAGLGGYVP